MFTKAMFPKGCSDGYRFRCLKLNLEPLWMRRLKLNRALFHRLIHSQIHSSITKPSFITPPSYSLRDSACKLRQPLVVTNFRQNFFIPLYTRIWNKLPSHVRSLDNSHIFTRKINEFITIDKVEELISTQLSLDTLFESGPRNI